MTLLKNLKIIKKVKTIYKKTVIIIYIYMIYNNIWKVSWKDENIDYFLLINDFKNRIHNGLILQEIDDSELDGYVYPDANDTVFITCNNTRIIRCTILVTNIVGKFKDKYIKKEKKELTNYNLL